MNKVIQVGKFLDQPRLVGKFSQAVPVMLIAGSAALTYNHIRKTPEKEKRKEFIKSLSLLSATIGSALIATRGLGQIRVGKKVLFNGIKGLSEKIDLNELTSKNTKLVNDFLINNTVSSKTAQYLEKAKTKILNYKEFKIIFEELYKQKKGKEFLKEFIPDPENVDSKHIFAEIKRLSLMGLVPVIGGVAGGVLGDKLTEKDWKDRIPNKIKEGSYQYLANIFLCNIGAGGALFAMEKGLKFVKKCKETKIPKEGFKKYLFNFLDKTNMQSKTTRAIGMVTGILLIGVIGGSAIANLIGKFFIDPLLPRRHRHKHGKRRMHHNCLNQPNCRKNNGSRRKGLYSERRPEALDIGLHTDDIATVAVLSGLKWIEPALPILYSISGYKAGIGYRNGEQK